MPLDTQTFGITRHWFTSALRILAQQPDIFARKQLRHARKTFLAGANQLKSIKNWLTHGGVIETVRGRGVVPTDLGRAIVAKDATAEKAWTWWLFHLHLSANDESRPYSTFFRFFDAESASWMSDKIILERLLDRFGGDGNDSTAATVATYFQGVQQSFRPGWPLHDLKLLEHRLVDPGRQRRFRRSAARPADIVVAYATLIFHKEFCADKTTIEARVLLDKGLGRIIGLGDHDYRKALERIHHHPQLGAFLQYRGAVNLDSVQFLRKGEPALKDMRVQGYADGVVQWP